MRSYSCDVNTGYVRDENGKRFKTYGLSFMIDGKYYHFTDLSTDKERIISLAERLETEIPEPKILYEIFDDYIFQK